MSCKEGAACFFVPVESHETTPLQQRKPGTPTKRPTNSGAGAENKTRMGNQMDLPKSTFKSVPGKPELPMRLKKRLASLPARRSPERILQREAEVIAKRAALIEAKVNVAKSFVDKCNQVRARKAEFDGNVIFLNMPSSPSAKPFKVPKSIKLTPVKSGKFTFAMIMEKIQKANERREQFLQARVNKSKGHSILVRERMVNKRTVQRFTEIPDFLPEKLQKRLITFRQRTPDAILRQEANAKINRDIILQAKVHQLKMKDLIAQDVITAKAKFVENEVDFSGKAEKVNLPKKLANRLANFEAKIPSPEKLIERCEAAEKRRLTNLEKNQLVLKEHQNHVEKLVQDKFTTSRFPNAHELSNLPKRLQDRLATFRIPTAEALLRKEKLIAKRGELHRMQISQNAKSHSVQVKNIYETKQSMKENLILPTTAEFHSEPLTLPASIIARLTKRVQRNAKSIMSDFNKKIEVHDNILAIKKSKVMAHNEKVQNVMNKKNHVDRFTNVSADLPTRLKNRLQQFKQRTPEAILRHNEVAVRKAIVAKQQKAYKAKALNQRIAKAKQFREKAKENDIHFFENNTTSVVLPKNLAKRIEMLKPKWTVESVLLKNDAATERRERLFAAKGAKVKAHNHQVVVARMNKKHSEKRFNEEKFVEYLPDRLRARLATFTKPTPESILRREAVAANKHANIVKSIAQKAKEHALVVEQVKAVKQIAKENDIDYSGVANKVPLPDRLAKRLASFHQRSTDEILGRSERAYKNRSERLESVRQKNQHHLQVVAQRLKKNTTEERYAPESYATLPPRLQNRLKSFRKPTPTALLRKDEIAYNKAGLLKQAVVTKAKFHSSHVDNVIATHLKFRDTMDIMTHNCTVPVKLPKNLQKRLADIESHKRTVEQLFDKEKQAHMRRTNAIADRREKAAEYIRKVNTVKEAKMSQRRFDDAHISNNLPERLQQRLKGFRVPTSHAITNREERARLRHELLLEAKVKSAHAHSAHVARVKATKAEFAANNIEYGQERHEVQLPARLQNRLDTLKSKLHNHTPEKILKREEEAFERRQQLLSKRIEMNHKHSERVSSLLSTKKRVEEEEQPRINTATEVPETD